MPPISLSSRDFWVGDWFVQPALTRIRCGDETVHVTPRAMAVLVYLAEAKGGLVSRSEILDAVWPRMAVTQDALSQCIVELRKAFRDNARKPSVIETIPKMGVRLIASVAPADAETAASQPLEAVMAGTRHRRTAPLEATGHHRRTDMSMRTTRRAWWLSAALAVLAVAIVLGGAAYWLTKRSDEWLTKSLSALRSELAVSMANALEASMMNEELARLREHPPRSEAARDHYLRGTEIFRRGNNRIEELSLAREQYERAIIEDPEFALAHASLAVVSTGLHWFDADPTGAHLAAAEEAIQSAFDLVPDLPEAHLARANFLSRILGQYDEALAEFAIAEASIPRNPDLYLLRASTWRRLGNWQESIGDLDRAIRLNNTNTFYRRQQHVNHLFIRDYVAAEQYLDEILAFASDDATVYVDKAALALFRDGDTSLANQYDRVPPTARYEDGFRYAYTHWLAAVYDRDPERAFDILHDVQGESVRVQNSLRSKALLLAHTHRIAGNDAQARAHYQSAVNQIAAKEDPDTSDILDLAEAQAGLGRKNEALESIERARASLPVSNYGVERSTLGLAAFFVTLILAEEGGTMKTEALDRLDEYLSEPGHWSIEGLSRDPRLEPLLEDPRFDALVEKYKRR